MTRDSRNTRVVISFILSMTFGAAVLMVLETPTSGWPRDARLMADRGGRIEAATLYYVAYGEPVLAADFDGVITADGEVVWEPRAQVRDVCLAVHGAPDDSRMPAAQQRALLRVLGAMKQQRGLDLTQVRLDPDSDVRYRPELPDQAGELRQLLLRKSIIR